MKYIFHFKNYKMLNSLIKFIILQIYINYNVNFGLSYYVGVSRGYTDYHQGRAIHMADSRIH